MTYEAILVNKFEDAVDFTVSDTWGVEKGTVMALTDPRTVSGVNLSPSPIAGIAAREKIAGDGRTRIPVIQRGIFEMYSSGTINVGDNIIIAPDVATYPNHVAANNAVNSGAAAIGYALEACATNTRELFHVKVCL